MEQINENVIKDLFSKVKKFFAKEYKETPEDVMYHEIITKLSISLQELMNFLNDEFFKSNKNSEVTTNAFQKMESVNDIIRTILGIIKDYKIKTKNNQLSQKLYDIIITPLHNINKDTRLIDYEKLLISILQKMIKIANFYQDEMTDAEMSAKEKFKNIFMFFPTDDYGILSDLMSGKVGMKKHKELDSEYIKKIKSAYDKETVKVDSTANKDNYENEWKDDSEDIKIKNFIDAKKEEDFERLWDEKFRKLWKAEYQYEAEKQREQLSHLKETVQQNILETFLKE